MGAGHGGEHHQVVQHSIPVEVAVTAPAVTSLRAKAKVPSGSVAPHTKNVVSPVVPAQKSDAVFLKKAVIHDTSLDVGQSSKKEALLEDDMNVDSVVEQDFHGTSSKGRKEKDKWCFRCCTKGHVKEVCKIDLFVIFVRVRNMWLLDVQ